MSLDNDTTTLGEYFEPIALVPAEPAATPVSAELVRVLTSDIRHATVRQMLSTPALAEALIAKGWRPAVPNSLLPSWATPGAQVCVLVTCSRCSEEMEGDGGPIHFTSVQDARDYVSGGDWWRVVGDLILCDSCQDAEEGE